MSEETTVTQEPTVSETSTEQVVEQSTVQEPMGVPEYFGEDPSLKDFKSVDDLAKSYKSAQAMIGGSVRIPGEDASEEQRAAFYEKLEKVPGVAVLPKEDDEASMDNFLRSIGKGRPETPDHYDLQVPEGADQGTLKNFKDFAYQKGYTSEQAQAAIEFQTQMQQQDAQYVKEMGVSTLKQMWGPDYDNRMEGAKSVANLYAQKYPEAMQRILNGPEGNNPAIIAMFSELGGMLQEKGVSDLATSPKYGMTREEAQMKVEEIYGNKTHAYWDAANPNHEDAVRRVAKLNEIISS